MENIKEFSFDLINPNAENCNNMQQGGSKIVIIGKPGTGKSTLLKSILYNKKDIVCDGIVLSGSESTNKFFQQFVPSHLIYDKYDPQAIAEFIRRQKYQMDPRCKTPCIDKWSALVIDDCSDNTNVFKHPLQHTLFKNGRHLKMLYILSLQYALDVPPHIRTAVDGTFIFRETNLDVLKKIYSNYVGLIIPTFNDFKELMLRYTQNYTCIFINNAIQSNNWQDCVYWCKAEPAPTDFKFGCHYLWDRDIVRVKDIYLNKKENVDEI
jgi:GTPase SAR1 family protein